MNERQLDQRLRAWYRAEVSDLESAPPSLGRRVAAIPEAAAPRPVRLRWAVLRPAAALLAVGLVLALLLGALAAGARRDAPVLRSAAWPALDRPCERGSTAAADLPEDLVLRFDDQGGFAQSFELRADGSFVRAGQGRLSERGMTLVLDAVATSGLLAHGCHLDLWDEERIRGVSVRSLDGTSAVTHWGAYSGFRSITEREREAAAELTRLLRDLEAWLPPDAWIERPR